MEEAILIDKLNNSKKNVKSAVIEILSLEWPLSAKEVYNKVKKITDKNITYQAVYKTIKELVEKKVILNNENKIVKILNAIESI